MILTTVYGVKKYKPVHTPRGLELAIDGRSTRAEQLRQSAASTVAHTRELLKESRELIEHTKERRAAIEGRTAQPVRLDKNA